LGGFAFSLSTKCEQGTRLPIIFDVGCIDAKRTVNNGILQGEEKRSKDSFSAPPSNDPGEGSLDPA
jgi:hypothetical protein